jgi:hypothetical protein
MVSRRTSVDKLSADKVLTILAASSSSLKKLASERDTLETENVQLKKELETYRVNERVEKIACEVHNKGVEQGRTMDETREFLLQKAASGKLDAVEEALGWSVSSTPLGHVGEVPVGENSLYEFILS